MNAQSLASIALRYKLSNASVMGQSAITWLHSLFQHNLDAKHIGKSLSYFDIYHILTLGDRYHTTFPRRKLVSKQTTLYDRWCHDSKMVHYTISPLELLNKTLLDTIILVQIILCASNDHQLQYALFSLSE